MDLSLMGERIKLARDGRGFTQIDVVRKLQYPIDTKTLSKWENGRQQPKPENLHDLAQALGIRYEEEIYWLGLSGYIPPTRMPTKDEIRSVLEIYYRDIQDYPFPALIVDYRNNVWAINPAMTSFVESFDSAAALMKARMPNIFEFAFKSELVFGNNVVDADDFRKRQIVLFIFTNLHRRHEPFFRNYPECWKNQLLPADYAKFEALWFEVCHDYLDASDASQRIVQYVVNLSYISLQTSGKKAIRFKIIAEAPGYFYYSLFHVLRYSLVHESERLEAEQHFQQFRGVNTSSLKQWDLRDLDSILSQFDDTR